MAGQRFRRLHCHAGKVQPQHAVSGSQIAACEIDNPKFYEKNLACSTRMVMLYSLLPCAMAL